MKKLLLGLAATTALISPVLAADLPAPNAPVYYKAPPPPVFSWTGCYIGADVGGGFLNDRDSEHTAAGGPSPFSPTNSVNPSGVMAGGFLGCNYQFSSGIVIGAEGDANWANIGGGSAQFPGSGLPGLPNDFYQTRSDFQASARGRLGYAFNRVLLYATGGAAWANVTEHDVIGSGPLAGTSNNSSATQPGWTVGAGLEYAFLNNLIGRVEYRYSDFGTFSYAPAVFAPFVENHRITENQVLVGLSYKFGGGPGGMW
jgi:outer membrane immunogenic protein